VNRGRLARTEGGEEDLLAALGRVGGDLIAPVPPDGACPYTGSSRGTG
jgi:hypothetical protein